MSAQVEAQRCSGRGSLVIKDGDPDDPLGRAGDVGSLEIRRQLSLPFIPAVLKPDFDLSLCQVQRGRQPRALGAAQVAFHVKCGLQLEHLAAAEHSPSLLLPSGARVTCHVLLRPCVQGVLHVLAVVRQVAVPGLPVCLVAALCYGLGHGG